MSTSEDYINFVVDQIRQSGCMDPVRYRKMFGEYMVYVDDRPVLMVCDDTVFVKKHDCLTDLLQDADVGAPYDGAKEHYILDIEDAELTHKVIKEMVNVTHIPVKKKRRKTLL